MAETPESAKVAAHAPAVAAFTTDVDGRVQSWSREAEHLFGYRAQDIAGRSWGILLAHGGDGVVHAADHQPAAHAVRRFRRQNQSEFVARHATVELTSFAGTVTPTQLIISARDLEHSPAVGRTSGAPSRTSNRLAWTVRSFAIRKKLVSACSAVWSSHKRRSDGGSPGISTIILDSN